MLKKYLKKCSMKKCSMKMRLKKCLKKCCLMMVIGIRLKNQLKSRLWA